MMRAVDGIKFMGGGTNTGNAIDYATDKMFTPALGARQDVSNSHTARSNTSDDFIKVELTLHSLIVKMSRFWDSFGVIIRVL